MAKFVSFMVQSTLLGKVGITGFGSLSELVRLALCDRGVVFTSFDIKFSKDGMVVKLWDATQNGTGAKTKYLIQNPPGCTGRVYVPKELLCECIRQKILDSKFFGKVTLKKPATFPSENFLECLKTVLKGYDYEAEVVDETTVSIYFPSGKLGESFEETLYILRTLRLTELEITVDGSDQFGRDVNYPNECFHIPEGMTIEEMMEKYQKVFLLKKIHLETCRSGGETRHLIFTMGLDLGYSWFDIFQFVRKYPIIECKMCCETFVWKNPQQSCCGGHANCCIPCINGSIQSALDNTSAAQPSVRCQFGCDKALIDFSDGKVVILSGLKTVLNKDTNAKLNGVALRLKETVDDSLKEAMRAEALSRLEEYRRETPQDAYMIDYDDQRRNNVNICPKCFALVVRTSGCNAMICECGTPFCIQCGTYDMTTRRCQCARSITISYFEGRLPEGLLTTRFEIREEPPSQS